jgi:hypothetical protein
VAQDSEQEGPLYYSYLYYSYDALPQLPTLGGISNTTDPIADLNGTAATMQDLMNLVSPLVDEAESSAITSVVFSALSGVLSSGAAVLFVLAPKPSAQVGVAA